MRNFKKGIWTVIALNFAFAFLITAVHYGSLVTPFFRSAFWLIPVFIIVPSFLLAMLVTVLFYKEGRENKIQFYCQLSGLVIAVCFFSYTLVKMAIDQRHYEMSTNHLSIEDSPKELQKALQAISNQFDSTTEITISSYWVSNEDPEEIKTRKASYAIYITYYLNADSSKEYYSKLIPHDSTYRVEVLNDSPELNPEVSGWRQEVDNALHQAQEERNKK